MNPAAPDSSATDAGFSLLEALIALVILAIASATLVGASESHLDRIGGLEDRAVASWVAEAQLSDLRIAVAQPVRSSTTREMAGRSWRVETAPVATNDPELVRVDISVSDASGRDAQARLSGFVDVGAAK